MHNTLARMREKRANDEGFTLIELLVVVVIIGVLVAIAVPVYLNYRKGAADKSAQSDVRGGISAVEQYYTDNNNTYPPTIAEDNTKGDKPTIELGLSKAQKITLSDKTLLGYVISTDGLSYKICAKNAGGSTDRWYLYDSSVGGSVKESTTKLATATCAGGAVVTP